MGTSFEARFTTTKLDQLLDRLEVALPAAGLRFGGAVFELVPDRGGRWPTVAGLDAKHVDTLAQAAAVGSRWWGFGFELVSEYLLKELGRTTVVEVYLNVFQCASREWTLTYTETSGATDHRIRTEDGASNLLALQVALCKAGAFELSIYAEEDHEGTHGPVATLREAEVAIKRVAANAKAGDLSVVASLKSVSFERARSLAGPRADQVKLVSGGYVAFPFLAPAR